VRSKNRAHRDAFSITAKVFSVSAAQSVLLQGVVLTLLSTPKT
jgi:hypothetical protein